MSVPAAFITVVLIWSTTPLAIKWSSDGIGFLSGVTARMLIGLVLCALVVRLLRIPMHRDAGSRRVYLIAGLGIYGAMMAVYWGAQYIPSGMVSVIFGLSPILTGVLAAVVLNEQTLTPLKIGGGLLGLGGLLMIFSHGISGGTDMFLGFLMVLLSTLIHCISGVWIKRLNMPVHALAMTTGGLMVAVPLYLLTWIVAEVVFGAGALPQQIPARTLAAVLYLGVFATVFGFALYYFLLSRVTAGSLSLVTLITPVLALYIGSVFNNEVLTLNTFTGTGMILAGLSLYHWRALRQLPGVGRRMLRRQEM